MKFTSSLLTGTALLALAISASAKSLWSGNSLSLLDGSHYEVGDPERWVLTFEHTSGHTWGDLFLFVDRLNSANGSHETYMELSPRLRVFTDTNKGLLGDLFIAYTLEAGESSSNSFNNQLLGAGINLNIPGFNYVQLNSYYRDNDGKDNNWQLTPVWGLPFTLGNQHFLYDGFIDWSSANNQLHASLNFTSQLKWDAGRVLFDSPKTLYLGIEYAYWRNKYGIANSAAFDTNESNVSALMKFHF